jgi:hypothetical protein
MAMHESQTSTQQCGAFPDSFVPHFAAQVNLHINLQAALQCGLGLQHMSSCKIHNMLHIGFFGHLTVVLLRLLCCSASMLMRMRVVQTLQSCASVAAVLQCFYASMLTLLC